MSKKLSGKDLVVDMTLNRAALTKILSSLSAIIPTKSPLPILSTVEVAAFSDGVELTGTDLDNTLTVTLNARDENAEIHKEGAMTINPKAVPSVIKNLDKKKDRVQLSADAENIHRQRAHHNGTTSKGR